MRRILIAGAILVGFTLSATLAQAAPRQRMPRAPRVRAAAAAQPQANFGFANNGFGFGNPGFGFGYSGFGYGYPAYGYGYPAYGYGYPAYSVPVYGGGSAIQGYNYTTDPFGGSPSGGNYDYWLTQQAAHGNISWAEANHRMTGN